jgi:hypothetical protein
LVRGRHIGYPVSERIVGLSSSIVKRSSTWLAGPNFPAVSLMRTRAPVAGFPIVPPTRISVTPGVE